MKSPTKNRHNGQGGTAAGIDTTGGSGSRIEGNQARDNTGTGILASGGDIILRNSAGNNTVANFNPASGINFAPVQSPSTATSPLANISILNSQLRNPLRHEHNTRF